MIKDFLKNISAVHCPIRRGNQHGRGGGILRDILTPAVAGPPIQAEHGYREEEYGEFVEQHCTHVEQRDEDRT